MSDDQAKTTEARPLLSVVLEVTMTEDGVSVTTTATGPDGERGRVESGSGRATQPAASKPPCVMGNIACVTCGRSWREIEDAGCPNATQPAREAASLPPSDLSVVDTGVLRDVTEWANLVLNLAPREAWGEERKHLNAALDAIVANAKDVPATGDRVPPVQVSDVSKGPTLASATGVPVATVPIASTDNTPADRLAVAAEAVIDRVRDTTYLMRKDREYDALVAATAAYTRAATVTPAPAPEAFSGVDDLVTDAPDVPSPSQETRTPAGDRLRDAVRAAIEQVMEWGKLTKADRAYHDLVAALEAYDALPAVPVCEPDALPPAETITIDVGTLAGLFDEARVAMCMAHIPTYAGPPVPRVTAASIGDAFRSLHARIVEAAQPAPAPDPHRVSVDRAALEEFKAAALGMRLYFAPTINAKQAWDATGERGPCHRHPGPGGPMIDLTEAELALLRELADTRERNRRGQSYWITAYTKENQSVADSLAAKGLAWRDVNHRTPTLLHLTDAGRETLIDRDVAERFAELDRITNQDGPGSKTAFVYLERIVREQARRIAVLEAR